jgi:protein SCO1/2
MNRRAVLAGVGGAGFAALRAFAGTATAAPSEAMQIDAKVRLVDQFARPFAGSAMLGRPSLLYFGYRLCPEACPTTLAAWSAWIRALGADANRLNFIFVSIDPTRDTPKLLKQYLADFDPHIVGLTGDPAEVERLVKAFHVHVKKRTYRSGDYELDHTTFTLLLDRRGQYVETIDYDAPNDQALGQIRYLLSRPG